MMLRKKQNLLIKELIFFFFNKAVPLILEGDRTVEGDLS